MKNNIINVLLFFLTGIIGYSQDASINLYPANLNQAVTFGGDGKLTIHDWANGNLNLVAQRLFVDMNLEIFRIPIFANQEINSPIYDDVIAVVKSVQQANPNVKIIVVDPRRTQTCDLADLHLQILPGTDVILYLSLIHI